MGKRKAYKVLVIQQRQRNNKNCKVTLYSLLTSYSISTASIENRAKLHSPPLLDVNDKGIVQLTKETKKFIVGNYVYTRLQKDCVVNMCPHVPLDFNDERSCYSILLVHTVWPIEGEINILNGKPTAIERLRDMKQKNDILPYVSCTLERNHQSQTLRNQAGTLRDLNNNNDGIIDDESADNDDAISIVNSHDEDEKINDQM